MLPGRASSGCSPPREPAPRWHAPIQRQALPIHSPNNHNLCAEILGLVLLGIGIEIAWRRPRTAVAADDSAVSPAPRVGRTVSATILTFYFVALWLLWVAGAMKLFWLAAILALL